jgi:hypothetical protein
MPSNRAAGGGGAFVLPAVLRRLDRSEALAQMVRPRNCRSEQSHRPKQASDYLARSFKPLSGAPDKKLKKVLVAVPYSPGCVPPAKQRLPRMHRFVAGAVGVKPRWHTAESRKIPCVPLVSISNRRFRSLSAQMRKTSDRIHGSGRGASPRAAAASPQKIPAGETAEFCVPCTWDRLFFP